jgi:hypothetical protein
MAFKSILEIISRGNPVQSLSGAYGPSPYDGGGLWTPFFGVVGVLVSQAIRDP